MYKFVLLAKCFLINETKMLKLGVVLIEDQGKYRICDKKTKYNTLVRLQSS